MEKRKNSPYYTPEIRNGSVVLFKNPTLERHSHVHPITPLLFWTPVIGYLLWRAFGVHELSLSLVIAIAFAALIVWSFTEYVLHRFVFHFKPWGPRSAWVSYLVHWVHHDAPEDKTRLVMPPLGAAVLALFFYGFFRLIMGPVYVDPFFGFFLVGYLIYDYTHYALHHFRPRTALGRSLKKIHMHHHFVNHDSYWGVSTPLWDWVFGTAAPMVRATSVPRKEAPQAKPQHSHPIQNPHPHAHSHAQESESTA